MRKRAHSETEMVRAVKELEGGMPTHEKQEQELASLRRIDDSFKKIIVVKDDIMPKSDESGIMTMGVLDFLLNPGSLDY